MARLSMSGIWDETTGFLAREKGLVFPLGLATFGLGLLITMFGLPQSSGSEPVPPGPWMFWLLPALILATVGYLSVSAITLMPNISVREALGVAMARLPTALLLTLILLLAMMGIFVVAGLLLALVGGPAGWSAERAAMASIVIAAPFIVWVSIRLITLWPLLIDRSPGAMAAIRESFRLTGGHGLKIAGVVLLAGSAYLLATGVAQIAGGSVFLLLGRAIGDAAVGRLLTDILVAAVAGLLATVWSVFVALLYRRLAGSSNGI
jgi:hypothetical protein